MRKINMLPNFLTELGLAFGLFVIFRSVVVGFSYEDAFHFTLVSATMLMIAALADLLDGAVARALNAQSEFGGQFDSLADAVSFAVAPAVIMLRSFVLEPGTDLSFIAISGALVYSTCGILRLVRFNVASQQPTSLEESLAPKSFVGMPIPAAAAAVMSANLFMMSPELLHFLEVSDTLRALIMVGVMGLIGYFMVSPWRFPSFQSLHIRVRSFQLVFIVVLATVLLAYGVLLHFPVMFFLASWIYVILSVGLSATRLIAGRRSRILEAFEPASDEF